MNADAEGFEIADTERFEIADAGGEEGEYSLFSSRTHLITRINCGEERVGEGGKRDARAGAMRRSLALRCPVNTTPPDGPDLWVRNDHYGNILEPIKIDAAEHRNLKHVE